MLKEIATFILGRVSPHPYWERDINFFVGHIPLYNRDSSNVQKIKRMTAIIDGTSSLVGQLPDRADKTIQILNRNDNYFEAYTDAMEFFNRLHGLSGCDLPVISSGESYTAMIIDAIAQPYAIENPDEKGRFVFSTNYLFRIRAD